MVGSFFIWTPCIFKGIYIYIYIYINKCHLLLTDLSVFPSLYQTINEYKKDELYYLSKLCVAVNNNCLKNCAILLFLVYLAVLTNTFKLILVGTYLHSSHNYAMKN